MSRDVIFDERISSATLPIQNDDKYITDAIIGERMNTKGKKEFLVKWLGFGDEEATWEPIEHVEETEALSK